MLRLSIGSLSFFRCVPRYPSLMFASCAFNDRTQLERQRLFENCKFCHFVQSKYTIANPTNFIATFADVYIKEQIRFMEHVSV